MIDSKTGEDLWMKMSGPALKTRLETGYLVVLSLPYTGGSSDSQELYVYDPPTGKRLFYDSKVES